LKVETFDLKNKTHIATIFYTTTKTDIGQNIVVSPQYFNNKQMLIIIVPF